MRTTILKLSCLLLAAICVVSCCSNDNSDWRENFSGELPLLGHRNWVLIVDAAYPLQSSQSIKTIVADEDIASVAKEVLSQIHNAPHVKPIVYQDMEFAYMKESWSRGCEELRGELNRTLQQYNPKTILHDEIFERLDKASELFNVVVVKSNCTTPYSSIFIELDCGYWQSEYEQALRNSMCKK